MLRLLKLLMLCIATSSCGTSLDGRRHPDIPACLFDVENDGAQCSRRAPQGELSGWFVPRGELGGYLMFPPEFIEEVIR